MNEVVPCYGYVYVRLGEVENCGVLGGQVLLVMGFGERRCKWVVQGCVSYEGCRADVCRGMDDDFSLTG